jgi:thiamine biosynthesis lipoprotein
MDFDPLASERWTDWSCRVQVTVADPGLLAAARAVTTDLMSAVSRAVNRFDPASELSAVNRRAGTMTPVSSLFDTLVALALDAAELTGGACDPTVGLHLSAAGYDRDIDAVRHRDVAGGNRRWTLLPDWRRVRRNRDLRLIGVPAGTALDLGATAKAWTAQRCAERISGRLGTPALVSIGGDVFAAGARAEPWRVTVSEHPNDPGQLVALDRGALTTSTTTLRTWTRDGQPAHHIIDPRSGLPSTGRWRTASVWADDAVRANALSTAVLARADDALTLLGSTGTSARLVDRDGDVCLVGDWPAEGAEPGSGRMAA